MTAREKFKKGQPVQTTQEAKDFGATVKKRLGIVSGFSYEEKIVIVQQGVAGNRSSWHMNFWEPIE
ncbi:MAG: hypothetical protein NVS9B14_21550 [Candidatus Acidiferrum sp.]